MNAKSAADFLRTLSQIITDALPRAKPEQLDPRSKLAAQVVALQLQQVADFIEDGQRHLETTVRAVWAMDLAPDEREQVRAEFGDTLRAAGVDPDVGAVRAEPDPMQETLDFPA